MFARWITALLRRGKHLFPLAMVFSLILQLVPLDLPVPSRVVNKLLATSATLGHRLSVLPAWMDPDAEAITEALAPVDRLAASLGPPIAHAQGTTTLQFAKFCEPDPVNQGGWITYSLYITNSTLYTATILITDTFPAETEFISLLESESTSGGADWGTSSFEDHVLIYTNDYFGISGNGLPPGGAAIRKLLVRASRPLTDQMTITNTAVLTANIDSELTRWCTTIVNAPNLVIAKTPSMPVVDAGDPLTWTLYVTNTGHLTMTQPFTVTDHIPDGTNYVTSTMPSAYSDAVRTITWMLGADLGQNQGVTRTFVVTITSPYTNGAIITNTTYRAWSSEVLDVAEGAPVTITVRSHSVLTLTKSSTPDPVQAGGYLTYTLTLANQNSANGPAQNMIVTDTVPISTTYDSCSGAPCAENGGVITWTLPTTYSLPVNQSTQLTFTVQIYSPLISDTTITNQDYGVTATNALTITAGEAVTTTVNSSPNLTVTKSATPSSVLAGQAVTYTIVITNKGNETATGVDITDTLPVSFTYGGMVQGPAPNGSPTTVLTWTGQTVTGTIVPGGWTTPGPLTLVFTATTNKNIPDAEPAFPNYVTVTYGTTDVATGPTAPVTVTKPQLNIAKVPHADVVSAGGALTYTITYSNPSNTQATSVVITDLLPSHVYFVTTTGDFEDYAPVTPTAGNIMTYTVGNVAQSDGVQSITLVVVVTTPLTSGTVLTNEARISAIEPSAGSTGPVTTVVQSVPDIVLYKYASADTVSPSSTLTYTLEAINNGNANATGVVITDVLPSHTHFVTATGNFTPASLDAGEVMTWTVGDLLGEGQQTFTATLVVTIATPLTDGLQIPNTARINSAEGVSATNAVTVTVSSTPTLTLTKQDGPDPVAMDGTLLYTITVTNLDVANAPATGVVVTDAVPASTTFLSATQTGLSGPVDGTISWTLPNLAPDSSAVVTFTVRVDPGLEDEVVLTNTASVACTQGVTATDTETTTVHSAILKVTKSALPTTFVRPNELITYVIVFSNTGNIEANGVRITDTLPVNVSLVTSETVGASFVPGSTYAWFSSTMAVGSMGIITITAQVTTTPGWIDPDGSTIVENNVVITSTTPNGTLSDYHDAAQTTIYAGLPAMLTLTAAPATTTVDGQATVTVAASDQWGNPVMNQDNVTVTLETSLAGSQIVPTQVTMALGQAIATITSTVTGVTLITGTVGANPAVNDTTQVTFTAGTLHHFIFEPIADQIAGVNFAITITAYDQHSNVADYNGIVTLEYPDLSLWPVTSGNFSNGVLAGQVVSITIADTNRRIWAISDTVDIYPSNFFTVSAGAPASMTLTATPDTVGVGVNAALRATVSDAYDNRVPNEAITFTSVGLGGGGIVPATDTTDVVGQATSAISSTLLGTRTVTATAANGLAATTQVTFTVGPPAFITLTIVPPTNQVGTSAQIMATVVDAYDNPVENSSIRFETTDDLGSGGITSPASTNADGMATSTISSTVSGVKVVTATAPNGVNNAAPVTFTAGTLNRFIVGQVDDPQTAGDAFTLTITAVDEYGNTAVGFTGEVTMTDSTGTLSPVTSGSFVGGVRSVNVSITLVQEDVSIVVTNTGGTETGISNLFDVVANDPATITLLVDPVAIPLLGTALLTATVTDAWGNLVADDTTVSFGTTHGTLNPTSDDTVNGQAESQLTAGCFVWGWVNIQVTAGSAFTSTTVAFTSPGVPTNLSIVAAPTNIPVGTGTAVVTATVTDCALSPMSDQLVNLAATLGSLPASDTTDVNGIVTVTLSAGTAAGTSHITATSDGLSATTTVVIEPGTPATVMVTANPTSIPANGSATSTIAVSAADQYGNAVADDTEVTLDFSPTTLGTLSPLIFNTANGSGSAIFTAGIMSGTVTISATAGGTTGSTLLTLSEGIRFVYLPLVMRNHAPPSAYDLVVESVTWIPSPPTAGEPYHVQVVIRNDGTAMVTDDFWVDLYLQPSTTPGINQTWNMLSLTDYGKAWLVHDDIGPGQTVTLLTSDSDDPLNPENRYSHWPPPPFNPSHNPFYVLVDSWGESYGLVNEVSEDNNLWGPGDASGLGGTEQEMHRQPGPTTRPSGPRPPFSLEGR